MIEWWAVLALISAVLFAVRDIMTKKYLVEEDIQADELILDETLILIGIIWIFFLGNVTFSAFFSLWPLFVAKALIICVAVYSYFALLKQYDISLVAPLINLSPILLIILSSFLLGEQLTLLQGAGVTVIILATYFLEATRQEHKEHMPLKMHFSKAALNKHTFFLEAVVVVLTFSMVAIVDKMILQRTGVYTNFFYTAPLIIIFVLLYAKIVDKKPFWKLFKVTRKKPIVLVPGFIMVLSNFAILFAIAIPTAMVSLIIPLRRTSTVFSALFGGILFHEKHLGKKMIAVVLMLLGIFLIV